MYICLQFWPQNSEEGIKLWGQAAQQHKAADTLAVGHWPQTIAQLAIMLNVVEEETICNLAVRGFYKFEECTDNEQ